MEFSPRGILTLIAFVWPVAFIFLFRKFEGRRFAWLLYLSELLLCAGSVYWLTILTTDSRWLYGAYVVSVALGLYALAVLASLFGLIRNAFLPRPP
jgi:hypothetical protein